MIGTAVSQFSPGELEFGIVLAVVAAALVYRSSERFRAMYGAPPWRIPSWIWTLMVFLVSGLVILYLIARATSRPRIPPGSGPYGMPPGRYGPYGGPPGPYGGQPGPYGGPPGPYGGPPGPYGGPPGPYGGPPGPYGGPQGPYGGPGPYGGQPGPYGGPQGPYGGPPGPPGDPGPYPAGPGTPMPPGAWPQQAPGGETVAAPGAPGFLEPARDPSGLPLPPNLGAGWYVDPTERFFVRFWDGQRWTDQVASGGQQATDPLSKDT